MTEVTYRGANYVTVQTKNTIVAVDPLVPGKKASKAANKAPIQLLTQPKFKQDPSEEQLVFDKPGDYECADISIKGADAISQLDPAQKSVMYRITTPDCVLAILGHVNPDNLTDDHLEQLGMVDIAIMPIGGNGYTIDTHGAVQLARRIAPKIVIPVHYGGDGIEYEVTQKTIEDFAKELGQEAQEEQTLKIKQPGQLPEALTLVKLARVDG